MAWVLLLTPSPIITPTPEQEVTFGKGLKIVPRTVERAGNCGSAKYPFDSMAGVRCPGEHSLKKFSVEAKGVSDKSILWRRLDKPGHESARLFFKHPYWHLAGTAVFAHTQQPCRLDYLVVCDSAWQTLSGKITGWVGDESIEIELSVDAARRWRLNGKECPEVAGCIDLDLNFSPSTNLLPIRRLGLATGQESEVRAAWLRFPSFTFEPLEQLYRRIDAATYRYESAGGRFVAKLQVNEVGFVTEYPNIWRIEEAA